MMTLIKGVKRALSHLTFKGSTQYWRGRYANGGNSGAGSNGRLRDYKADFVNEFILKHSLETVHDFGSGDGSFASRVKTKIYTGIDVSLEAIIRCYKMREVGLIKRNYTFQTYGTPLMPASLTLSLDVIYHLIEDDVYWDYLKDLFQYSKKYVIIYGYEHTDGKTWAHVKPRWFTLDIQRAFPEWELIGLHYPPYTWDESDKTNTTKSRFYIYKKKTND